MTEARQTDTGSESRRYDVVMPKLGLTMTRATIVTWYKQEGERVEKGEPLFTLETEKSTLDIESPAGGTLHIVREEGETVPVQTVIARIEVGEPTPAAEAPSPPGEYLDGATYSQVVRASPRARKLARDRGIDLSGLVGAGPRDMLVVADVERVERPQVHATPVARRVAGQLGVSLVEVSGTGPRGRIVRDDVERAARTETRTGEDAAARPSERPPAAAPLAGLRAVIAQRIAEGWRERPQVTLVMEVDATALAALRRQLNAELPEKVAYNAFLVKAAAVALGEQPHINAQVTEDGILHMAQVNIGLAVDTERGLVVPVLRDAGSKSLLDVNRELKSLAQRALAGASLPDELSGGTFTVTNLGMYDVDAFTPIINPPESAILGAGRISAKPVAVDGAIVIRDMLTLSLSFDHRLIDGAPAARFLRRIKTLLERPAVLLL